MEQDFNSTGNDEQKAKKNKLLGNIFVLSGVFIFMVGLFLLLNAIISKPLSIAIVIIGFVSLFVGIGFQSSKAVQSQIEKKNTEQGCFDKENVEKKVKSSGTYCIIFGVILAVITSLVLIAGKLNLNFAIIAILAIGYVVFGTLIRKNPLESKTYLQILIWPSLIVAILTLIITKSAPGILFIVLIGDLVGSLNKLKKLDNTQN